MNLTDEDKTKNVEHEKDDGQGKQGIQNVSRTEFMGSEHDVEDEPENEENLLH